MCSASDKKSNNTTEDLRCQEQPTAEISERCTTTAQVLMGSRSVPGRHALQERAVADPGEQAQRGRKGSEQIPTAGIGPYRAGDGPIALHDALRFLVAGTNFAVRATSHCLAFAACDLIPNKTRFTSPTLVGSLQKNTTGNQL